MKFPHITTTLVGLIISSTSYSSGTIHWGYSGDIGPDHWGKLAPEFTACSNGKNQSPINLSGMIEGDLPKLKLEYKTGGNELVNNGHTIMINYMPGSSMNTVGQSHELKHIHFHSPSEHTVNGQSYPMEAHFVHADKEDSLAVIAVLYEHGEADEELQKAWQSMPQEIGQAIKLDDHANASKLLPTNLDYYRFNGSLTTPPCSEGVKWYVVKQIKTASKEQIEKFSQIMGYANNRPVQPINARIVIQ